MYVETKVQLRDKTFNLCASDLWYIWCFALSAATITSSMHAHFCVCLNAGSSYLILLVLLVVFTRWLNY